MLAATSHADQPNPTRMKKHYLRSFLSLKYLVVAALTVAFMLVLLPLPSLLSFFNINYLDSTSPLNPIFSRLDFINIEDISLDAIFALKDLRNSDRRIVVVNVGEVAPTPDGRIAMLLYKLHGYGVRVIGIDVFFDKLHFEQFEGDRAQEPASLRQAFDDVPNIVIVNAFDEESGKPMVVPDSTLTRGVRYHGYANIEKDDDEVVRRYWPYRTIGGHRWLSLPVQMMRIYDSSLVRGILEGPEQASIINYCGTYPQFQTVPMNDVIFTDMYASIFKDAIVLVGFVNEGGLFYLDDTHKTPMGRKTERSNPDGTTSVGIEGPDMAGILIHANVLNMLLHREGITPVSEITDVMLAFLLAYVSIAAYVVLRTKARTSGALGMLITLVILTESVIVFFSPIIAYFLFDVKISYNMLASVVVLFIPVAAMVNKMHFLLLRYRARWIYGSLDSPIVTHLDAAFEDDEAVPANLRLVHAAQYLVHYACAVQAMERVARGDRLDASMRLPSFAAWEIHIPELREVLAQNGGNRANEEQHFFRYLSGKREQFLRDSSFKQMLFDTQLKTFNEFFFEDEWEVLLPHVLRLFHQTLRAYLSRDVISVRVDEGPPSAARIGAGDTVTAIPLDGISANPLPGLYLKATAPGEELIRLSPLCEYAECKLHRREELFVFAGLLPKQFDLPPLPAYFGATATCEPVLPPWTLPALTELLRASEHS
jgi:CHASE2 domain-containing sensor protein